MPRLTYVTRLWTVDHMRCSPPVRPAALKHGIGTRGGGTQPRRALSAAETQPASTALQHRPLPIEQPGGRFDRVQADSTGRGRPTGPVGVCRPGRPRADRTGRGLPIRPLQVAATGGNCRLGRARARSTRPVAAQGDDQWDRPPPRPDPRPIRPRITRLPNATAVDSARPSAKRSRR